MVGIQKDINTLLDRYEAFIIDLWGVVHDGVSAYPGVVKCLNNLIAKNKSILFMSNAPRPGTVLLKKILDFGIHANEEMILSSGDLIRQQLREFNDPIFSQLGRQFFHLGENRNQDILTGISVKPNHKLNQCHFILLTAYADEDENINQYDDFLKNALALNIPIICANPDKAIIHGKKVRYCAGIFAEKYEKMGGKVYYYGKPHPEIYQFALKLFSSKNIQKKQILAIGDTLETDIKGAQDVEIDSALTLTGNTHILLNQFGDLNPDERLKTLNTLFNRDNLYPTWIISGL